jgi:hypothetical protein
MYLQLYVNGYLKQQWYFEEIDGPLADRLATEARKIEMFRLEAQCLIEAEKETPNLGECEEVTMVWVIRSRVLPRDISGVEYAEFTKQITDAQVGRVVGKHRPKIENDKLK